MAIEALPVALEDFNTMRQFVEREDGGLSSVATEHHMTAETDEKAAIRNDWSLQVQQEIFENDKTAHFVKAIDTVKNNDILAIAHWHYYPHGYDLADSDMQYSGLKHPKGSDTYPEGLSVPAYKAELGSMINERQNWTGNGPQWILTNIKTRRPQRGRGAAGTLVQWGIERATEDKCPAFLEADPSGVSLYQKYGFIPVGDITVDFHPHGIPTILVLKKMIAYKHMTTTSSQQTPVQQRHESAGSKTDPDSALRIIEGLDRETFAGSEAARLQALQKARALCSRLETPWEALTHMIWQAPSVATATKVAIDLNLFNHLPNSPSSLAPFVGADTDLVRRILRLLASAHVIKETQPDVFAPTTLSTAFTKPGYIGGINQLFFDNWPTMLAIPKHLANNEYRTPTSPADAPFIAAKGMSFFEWHSTNKEAGSGFAHLMAEFSRLESFRWTDTYPLSRLTDNFPTGPDENGGTEGTPLVVDVGGGTGTSMQMLAQTLPPGSSYKLVVEDVESNVSEGQKLHPHLTFIAHDFFTPQPVTRARAYFLRNILHDWPNDKACLILRNIREAMCQGAKGDTGSNQNRTKSKLLLEENVLRNEAVDIVAEGMDFVMLALLASRERSEGDWRTLLQQEGFEIVKIWRGEATSRAVVEAELADGF